MFALAPTKQDEVDAVSFLRPFRPVLTAREAIDSLGLLTEGVKILALYRHFFPEEFAKCTARLLAKPCEPYSPAELEFFALLHERLFPLAYWFVDYLESGWEDEREREYFIPVWPIGFEWEVDEFHAVEPGWALIMAATGVERPDDPDEYEAQGFEEEIIADILDLPVINQQIYGVVAERCTALDGPVKHLPVALNMLNHSTDNPWLDAAGDQTQGPTIEQPWDIEGVEWLRDTYLEAVILKSQAEDLVHWLQEDWLHMAELICFYGECADAAAGGNGGGEEA